MHVENRIMVLAVGIGWGEVNEDISLIIELGAVNILGNLDVATDGMAMAFVVNIVVRTPFNFW